MDEYQQFIRDSNANLERCGVRCVTMLQCIKCGKWYKEEDVEQLLQHIEDEHDE